MQFSELFKDIMIEKDTNVQKLSKITGIDDSVLYDYLYGALPDVKYAVALANALDCSLNYLMGLDTDPKATQFKNSYDISLFSDRYDNLQSITLQTMQRKRIELFQPLRLETWFNPKYAFIDNNCNLF